MHRTAKAALGKPRMHHLEGKYPAAELAARINLHAPEDVVRRQITEAIEQACRNTDAAVVWDALTALRLSEQQNLVMAGLARASSMKQEKMERDARRGSTAPRRRKARPALQPVPIPND